VGVADTRKRALALYVKAQQYILIPVIDAVSVGIKYFGSDVT
jgi:hypothetical protein